MANSQCLSPPFPPSSALSKERLLLAQSPIQTTTEQDSAFPSDSSSTEPINHSTSTTIITHLPGEPSIPLLQPIVSDFLHSALSTPLLDQLFPHLWLIGRRSGKSIDPLNRQKVKKREIIATEDVRLHLIWHHDRIYIKPMPICLLNYDFWVNYLAAPTDQVSLDSIAQPGSEFPATTFDRKVALGFMRSYAFLVRHRLDFILARESHLFPPELDYEQFSLFISHFRGLKDAEVAKRYQYGQLRLSRLNWIVRIFRPSSAPSHNVFKLFYEMPYWSTGLYLQQAIVPLAFLFASLSLVLSSMQVLLSVPSDEGKGSERWDGGGIVAMKRAFWGFSIMILVLSGMIWVWLVVVPLVWLSRQVQWGYKNCRKHGLEDSVKYKERVDSEV